MLLGTTKHTAVLLSQQIAGRLTKETAPRLLCRRKEWNAPRQRRSARPQLQAVGGARDRKASRRDSASGRAALKQCSTRWKFTGTSSCGSAGANALDARKIDAQIAQ